MSGPEVRPPRRPSPTKSSPLPNERLWIALVIMPLSLSWAALLLLAVPDHLLRWMTASALVIGVLIWSVFVLLIVVRHTPDEILPTRRRLVDRILPGVLMLALAVLIGSVIVMLPAYEHLVATLLMAGVIIFLVASMINVVWSRRRKRQ